MSSADLARERRNQYAAAHPRIETAAAPTVQDDRKRNVIVITDRYTIRDLWRGGKFSYTPREIEERLERPETMVRTMPLAFDYPLDLSVSATFHLPERAEVDEKSGSVIDPAFRLDYATQNDGNVVRVTHRLRATRDAVPIAAVPDHLERINEISEDIATTLERGHGGVLSFRTASTAAPAAGIAVLVLIAAFAVGYKSHR